MQAYLFNFEIKNYSDWTVFHMLYNPDWVDKQTHVLDPSIHERAFIVQYAKLKKRILIIYSSQYTVFL